MAVSKMSDCFEYVSQSSTTVRTFVSGGKKICKSVEREENHKNTPGWSWQNINWENLDYMENVEKQKHFAEAINFLAEHIKQGKKSNNNTFPLCRGDKDM